jgi:hypothetical protein
VNSHGNNSRTASTASKENNLVTRLRRLTTRIADVLAGSTATPDSHQTKTPELARSAAGEFQGFQGVRATPAAPGREAEEAAAYSKPAVGQTRSLSASSREELHRVRCDSGRTERPADRAQSPPARSAIRFAARPRMRSAVGLAIAALIMAGAFLSATPPSASAAAPAWGIEITHTPAAFHREDPTDYYTVNITNVGNAETSGPFTLTDTLPAGLTIAPLIDVVSLGGSGGPQFTCTGDGSSHLTGASVLSCTRTAPLAPGETVSVKVIVVAANDAPDTVINEAAISGGGATTGASASDPTPLLAAVPFGIKSWTARTTEEGGLDSTNAGGHPFENDTTILITRPDIVSTVPVAPFSKTDDLKDAVAYLPPGFFGNPAAAARCPIWIVPQGETTPGEVCPVGSQVGGALGSALYNVKPDYGYPAQFGFSATGVKVSLFAKLLPRTESYGLTVGSNDVNRLDFTNLPVTFCGYGQAGFSCKSPSAAAAPFFTNPVDCSKTDPTWKLAINTWKHPGRKISGVPDLSDPSWLTATTPAAPVTGCDAPALADQFAQAGIATKPLQPGNGPVQADQPTGLAVDLDFPQSNDPTDPDNTTFDPSTPQAPEPKDITVKLPAGLSISPSSASGLGACSDQASDPAGDQVHYDNTQPVSCPDSSKIGSAVATSPLLALRDPQKDEKIIGPEPIPGDVYLLAPHPGDLPTDGGSSGGKFRLLIELENPRYGVNIKLPGTADADPKTGQLTATFTENPQLPSSHITVSLKEGPRAPLATPVTCGKFTTTSDLVPWSTPGTPDATPSASFEVRSGPNGTACPSSASSRPFAPALVTAGPDSTVAGASSPFTLKLTRNDGEGELSSLEATLPKGLAAKFSGIPYCPDAALASAATRSGSAEQAAPSCPAASRIGAVTVGAGPGSSPFTAHGNAYLAGPYKGAPMSVAVITPAVAGPFDLGTVVSRNALFINPETAQGRVVSDPLPTILDGVPLRLRDITVDLDRPNFTLNPTNCEPMSVQTTLHSTDGATSNANSYFQVGSCDKLGFKPTLKLSLKGKVSRRSHPSLRASLTARPGDANIAKAQVKLPKAAFLDNAHIGDICTRVQFAAKQCPPGSVYGYASATTPLIDGPLTGNVYLRANPAHKLPDLVVGFQGPANQQIEVELAGKTDSVKGALRNTFEAVPDVPVSKFSLTLFGGKKGLIVMSSGFCAHPDASIKFTGQNGMESDTTPKVGGKCPKKGGSKAKGPKGKKGKGAESRNGGGHRRLTAFVPGW